MKNEILLLLCVVTIVFAQRVPNIFSNNADGGFSFSNLFRPNGNSNRPSRQKPQNDSKKVPKEAGLAPFLVAPPPGFPQQPFQQPPPVVQKQPQSFPVFIPPTGQQPTPQVFQGQIQGSLNPQAVVPQEPLPLERPRVQAAQLQPQPFLQPQAQQPIPQLQNQVFVQQSQNPPALPQPAPPVAPQFFSPQATPASSDIFKRQPQGEFGFTPFAQPPFVGIAGVKSLPSPENQFIARPSAPQPNQLVRNQPSREREPAQQTTVTNKQPSLKEKAYLDCGPGNDIGFCAASDRYPGVHVDRLMEKCRPEVRKMYAEVPEDPELLADSEVASSVLKNLTRARDAEAPSWSWAAYKKESACDAERRLIVPGIARDRNGKWMVIVQTSDMPQRVHMEMCRNPEGACKVMSDCGKKSRCLQRYSWHLLIALNQDEIDACPRMAAFRFPTACVCHLEIDKPRLVRAPPMSKKMDQGTDLDDYEVINSEESLAAVV